MADRSLVRRMQGAARLDPDVFEEVEHDPAATGQAVAVVAVVAAAQTVGASGAGPVEMALAAVNGLLGWFIFAGLAYMVGLKIFGGEATWGEVFRTLGFAQTPGLLAVFAGLPRIGWLVDAVVVLWILWASVIALRQALDLPTWKTLVTAVIAGAVWGVLTLAF